MAEHTTPQSENGEEDQRIPPTLLPLLSTPYVSPAGHSEANSVQLTRISDQSVDGGLAPSARESSGSRPGNIEHRHTLAPIVSSRTLPMVDQNHISGRAGNVNQRSIDIPASTSQGSRDEGVNKEEDHDDRIHERKSTRSKSPTSPLSTTDDKTETDVTDYDDVDKVSGMDVNTGLPPFSG